MVIVLYKQKLASSQAYASLKKAEHSIYSPVYWVWDNSPDRDDTLLTSDHLLYQHHPENTGVSKAYNEAGIAAKRFDKQWILLADQDSYFPESTFIEADKAMQRNRQTAIFSLLMKDDHGIISPFQWKAGRGSRVKYLRPGIHSTREWCIINSGMLISRDLLEKCGGYDEHFPLDLSDVVFFDKVKNHCESFFLLPLVAQHSLSNNDPDFKNALSRFQAYSMSLMRYSYAINNNFPVLLVLLLRAVKLSFIFCSLSFLIVAINCLRKPGKNFL